MTKLTWLHLSDWHQTGKDFKRQKLRDALIRDIEHRLAGISRSLDTIDFIVFSGDVAWLGKQEEYQAAASEFFDPLLRAAGVSRDRLFIVPGNHDLDREHLYEMLPGELQRPFTTSALVEKWLVDDERRARTLEPFKAYRDFVSAYTGQESPDYAAVTTFSVSGEQVALLGLNSAWICARYKEKKAEEKEVNDYGRLVLGDPQLYRALQKAREQSPWVQIAVLHHSFDWLTTTDLLPEKSQIREQLSGGCHFVLHGHEHQPNVTVPRGATNNCAVISAGSSYERTDPKASRYAHGYNFVSLDSYAGKGTVYLRRYDERQGWIRDTGTTGDDTPGYSEFELPESLRPKSSLSQPLPAATPASVLWVSTSAPARRDAGERRVLEGYLDALVRNNADLDPRGIKTPKVQVVLPLEEIYVALQADRDLPDVDRRVMQEELDEIKERLEREEDPKEREKQYQIWANQARVLEQALEVSGPREQLSDIVQHHRQLVILGEPGSGKTTLVRYLALRLARAILAEPERLFQYQDLWDEKAIWRVPGLGPVRLPILLRVASYAEARQKDPDLSLVDYLPRYFAGLSVPHADELRPLLRRLLEAGRCIVLLDGLDEIIDPADRRNIAIAIGQFAGAYRETGLPDWLARSLTLAPPRIEDEPEDKVDTENTPITWNKNMPDDVRQEWEKRIKQRRREWRRGVRAMRLAWDLLDEDRYAHVGNRFVVTSRIAGYHFAGVPGEFEHYTIRRMSLDDIKLFLERWCPAVERRIAEAPDAFQVEQRARREIEGILHAVTATPGVRRMAENPLLLRILAIIHRNEAHLPQRRVELYETASVTLLRDWHLERGTKGAIIDDVKATSLLGPVALHIHETYASGFLPKGETEQLLGRILARERGENPEQPSLETREAVQQFLETVREHSGLFVERGEGLYGFMHLTFQEYFTARQLVSDPLVALQQIQARLHQPRWREPVLLAIGSVSKQFYEYTDKLLRAILGANSPYEQVLHRDLLFAAACVGDSVNVALQLRQEIASRLLSIYCDPHHTGRFRLLQSQVKEALLTLCNDQGDVAVEAALADKLVTCNNRSSFSCALLAVDWLKARTPAIARALAGCTDSSLMHRAQELLRAVQARLPVNGSGMRLAPIGWDAVCDYPAAARLVGAMWRYGWRTAMGRGLGVADEALREIRAEAFGAEFGDALGQFYEIARQLEDPAITRDTVSRLREELRLLAFQMRRRADESSEPMWREVSRELEMIAFGYSSWMPAPELASHLRRLVDQLDRVHREYSASVVVAAVPAEVQASLEYFERQLRTMEDTPEATISARRELARFAHEVELRARGSEASDLRAAAQQLGRLSDELGVATEPVDTRAILLRVRQILEGEASREALLGQLSRFGALIMRNAERGGALAPLFVARAARLIPVQPLPDEDALRANVTAIQAELADAVLDVLRGAADVQRYSDAALFLACTGEGQSRDEAIAIILADLGDDHPVRRRLALHVLTERTLLENVQFGDAQRALLFSLLDAPVDEATPALDILFALGLAPDLLARCWDVLRHPDHPLADAVREKLDTIDGIKGERSFLAVLNDGRRDPALRTVSLEMLRKVSWHGAETFAQAMNWLADEDVEVRQLAALLLASQDDLLAVPRSVLVKASQERLKAVVANATRGSGGTPRWSTLRDDAPLVRLLGGLWLNGWDEALTQLWVAQPAMTYVDQKHPSKHWRSFRTHPESEECIRWLLEKAESGQALISTFQNAAVRLAELEGDQQGAPRPEHIAAVQQEIGEQVNALLVQLDTPPLLLAEASVLAAAVPQESTSSVPGTTLQTVLKRANNVEWFAALSGLTSHLDHKTTVVAALNQAFSSPDRERRMLGLGLLSDHHAIRTALAETLTASYLNQTGDTDEVLAALGVLLQVKPSPTAVDLWLHSLIAPESDLPLASWLRQTLAAHSLTPVAPPPVLASLLVTEDVDVCAAASVALLAADLQTLVVEMLLKAAQSPDDRVRVKGDSLLDSVCGKLATDGSTQAIQSLLDFKRAADASKDGYLGTVSIGAVSGVRHTQPFWVARWLDGLAQENEAARNGARQALNSVFHASADVLSLLCAALTETARPLATRRAVADAFSNILKENRDLHDNASIHSALVAALDQSNTDIRRSAAYALQWTAGQSTWNVAKALLHSAECDPDSKTSVLALRSAGCVLHAVRGFRDVDVSKEALFRWLEAQRTTSLSLLQNEFDKAVSELRGLEVLQAMQDASSILDGLTHLDALGLSDETVARLRGSGEWDKLLESASQEWRFRRYWLETLPHLPAAITQVETLLAAPEPAVRRAASCALARLYHGDDDRPARLHELLHDDAVVLQALVDAVIDRDSWIDEGKSGASHHSWAIKQIAGWLEARPPDERDRLVATLLDDLESAMIGMGEEDDDDEGVRPHDGWRARRALVAVLAELSERLTYRVFTSQRDLANVVALFARAATDPGSYNSRRFAIRALGNLQQLTPQVADVFFSACQDVGTVYRETRTAVGRFKVFSPGSLERLTDAIGSSSITVAYHAALLLGELGVSRSEDLGREGRERVGDELVRLLESSFSERIVFDFAEDTGGKRVGPLYDLIYEALMRVVAGPDAPMTRVSER
jgi:hypothetical protein